MIQSFRCKDTQDLFEGGDPRQFRSFKRVAIRKLTQLDAAQTLDFLRSPPGNRLEVLRGNRQGQCSIRINDQYRICFVWMENGPADVEIVDYH
ncbi:MAG: type II toxin-antitoxin system RelE/ParE family toxin [Caldilineaceae bacterium]|nr:type II toxin-antitoxin system RelE/ParE family toxin [Caldilineaceae bacterium]MCB0186647.1 type II toxin-antitoxin system RelE/ParE family toxin [Caldilineaceae bacterium]